LPPAAPSQVRAHGEIDYGISGAIVERDGGSNLGDAPGKRPTIPKR
jgi:hypothetical protein